ncbi:MAG TPA: AAA family ATPase [Thermodesulfobacteriota bacterium]|jgi:endopeptidase Clp ATP-binding regulatory subunit ClpX
MEDISEKIPDQKELEQELNTYLEKKYGDRVKLVVSTIVPKPAAEQEGDKGKKSEKESSQINFAMKPEELISYLNSFIVKQDEAKEILATKICTHYNKIKFMAAKTGGSDRGIGKIKNNIIMAGPTGVGKTYMIKLIAQKIGVPFVKGDATKFSETGYVGGDVEDLLRDLVYEVNGDIERAQYGIVYIDEIDKIASSGNIIGPDVSRTGVQRALLKPMEETEVDLRVPHDPISQMEAIEKYRRTGKREKKTINTRNILFIVSGAFNGLEDIIKKRMSKEGIGFGAEIKSKDDKTEYLRHVSAEDLIAYGFESEFIGRLPVGACFHQLEVEDLYEILKNPHSPIVNSKKKDFQSYGIDLQFEDEALRQMARMAYQEHTGARGLISAIEKVLLKFERKLPSTNIQELVVTVEMVKNPKEELKQLLENPREEKRLKRFAALVANERAEMKKYIKDRESEFLSRYGAVFTEPRLDLVVDHVIKKETDVSSAFEEILSLYYQIRGFERSFSDRHGIEIALDDEAVDLLLTRIVREGRDSKEILTTLDTLFEPALQLIRNKAGVTAFTIPVEGVENPETYFDNLIKDTYAHKQ